MTSLHPQRLHDLLDTAADPAADRGAAAYDVVSDLDRGHRALGRSRRRRGAGALAALAVVGAVGVGTTLLSDSGSGDRVVRDDDTAAVAGIVAFAQPVTSGPYVLNAAPEGWEVQGGRPDHVTIAPTDGSTSPSIDDFTGKLVVMYDQNPLSGRAVDYEGRTFHARGDSDYLTLAVRTRPEEPAGEVLVQYPADSGFTQEQMLAFLDSVQIADGAQPGVG